MESNEADSVVKKDTDDEESNNEEESDIEFLDVESKLTDSEQDKRKLLRNGAWQFFEVYDAEQRVASCSLCQERFSYRTTSANLTRHLQRKHCIEFAKEERKKEEDDSDREDLQGGARKRSNTSAAWDYFEVSDERRRVATCKLCDVQCSYYSTVSNLMKHVRRKHKHLQVARQTEEDGSSSGPLSAPHALRDVTRSAMWNYFKMINSDEKIAMCLVCNKKLSYRSSVTNLKRHLYRKHPRLKIEDEANRVLISSNGQLYEIEADKEEHLQDDDDEQPTIDIHSVFMDDCEGEVTDETKSKGGRQKKRKKITLENTRDSDTSSDEITFQKRYTRRKTDALDRFGRYLVSIMKQLPKEMAARLQMDFVQQVVTAQLSCDARQNIAGTSNGMPVPEPVTSNGMIPVPQIPVTSNGMIPVPQIPVTSNGMIPVPQIPVTSNGMIPVPQIPVTSNGMIHVPQIPVTSNAYAITISSSQISSDHQYVVEEHVVEDSS